MEIPSNREIYFDVRRKSAKINTEEQIALDALLEQNNKPQEMAECATCEGRDFK
jgi:hypothetical protein